MGGWGGGNVGLQLSTVGPTCTTYHSGSWSGDNKAQLNVQIKGGQEEPEAPVRRLSVFISVATAAPKRKPTSALVPELRGHLEIIAPMNYGSTKQGPPASAARLYAGEGK